MILYYEELNDLKWSSSIVGVVRIRWVGYVAWSGRTIRR